MRSNPTAFHIFDMDGTLVDSKEATLQAYRAAANELNILLPMHLWGRSAKEWNCPDELHQRKTEVYRQLVPHLQRGWAVPHFVAAMEQLDNVMGVWTGASAATVRMLQAVPRLHPLLTRVKPDMAIEHKAAGLRVLRLLWPDTPIHYYDDDEQAAMQIVPKNAGVVLHLPGGEPCEL